MHRASTLIAASILVIAVSGLCACTADDSPPGPDSGPGSSPGSDAGDQQPPAGYCAPVTTWPGAWAGMEEDVLVLVNQVRSQGADCGSEGSFDPAEPLTTHPSLRCAAQVHSQDMHDRDFFDHTNPDGLAPWDRMALAGYSWSRAGENIAGGAADAESVLSQWMSSPGHCANIMSPAFVHVGAGFHGDSRLWTLVFGTP